MNTQLKRYWLSVVGLEISSNIGITAFSEEDVENILSAQFSEVLKINSIIIIESLDELDQNHVIPNMEEPICRGIWFPKGYRSTK
ncbi:hypothetical protein [Portibacter marinus]|uniref:hypothetical protein n=1 Tax=Portibacter marinus TaxID=2898660 RepID=UPI001F410B26|nr:hypothetical protein [Portibacter marinus]